MSEQNDNKNDNLHELIAGFDTAMLVTLDPVAPAGRPMAIAEHNEESGMLVFSTSLDTEKVDEIKNNSTTVVVMQSATTFVSLTGECVVSNDREKIRSLFDKSWELWYPEGPEQSDIRLLEFTPVLGEYWDISGTKGIRFAWQAGKALLKGEGLKPKEGLHHAETAL